MKSHTLRVVSLLGGLAAFALSPVRAQLVEFRAAINAAQETTGSTSTGAGSAVMLYDIATNKYDLTVTVSTLPTPITASHLHEAPPGTPGPVVSPLGGEAVYSRNGDTVTGTFHGVTYGGTPLTLLRNGAYINLHSATYPGGEVRGQLIAQPIRLSAVLGGAASTAYGAALITYDPGTNHIWTRINIYNFTNTLTNSHYHEAAPGANGGVVHGLGGATVYTQTGTAYGAMFADQTYGGDPWKLLSGGAYINVHSNVAPGGEIRGQVYVVDEFNIGRVANVSARAAVAAGDGVLIAGFVITGNGPVRVLITARGPSLAAFGVTGALADPVLSLHDRSGREILVNDNFADAFAAADLPATGFAPTDAKESALLLVLPPGVYSTVVTGAGGGTGVALVEVYESRPNGTTSIALNDSGLVGPARVRALAGLPTGGAGSPLALAALFP